MATAEKPKTADGYDSAQTLACERVREQLDVAGLVMAVVSYVQSKIHGA